MLEFVSYIGNRKEHETYEKDLAVIYNYANFLNQPLKLEMFVPCDEDGNVLAQDCIDYDKACENVLFTNTQQVVYRGTRCLLIGKSRFYFNTFEAIFKNKKLDFFAHNFELILKEEAFNRIFL